MTGAVLVARPVLGSVEELLADARRLGPYAPAEARSSATFERVEVAGEEGVVKFVHPDLDVFMRVGGDIGCVPRRVWAAGVMDLAPDVIDHAVLGVSQWGRHGWGAALLMRDVAAELVPAGDAPVSEDVHLRFLDAMAALALPFWGCRAANRSAIDLLPHAARWSFFGPEQLQGEAALGWPEAVPRIAIEGWQRFAEAVPSDVAEIVVALAHDPGPLADAVATTPQTFLHGDWKMGNLGCGRDGRVVLLDWTYCGIGPIAHDLAWYLALNRARLPVGHSKESTIADLRSALERRGIDTAGWWERQVEICLLGALVEFGWEKAFGPDEELAWWVDSARRGARWL